MNRLKAKEVVWKYVRFLEPSIWQRQRPNKAADSCTNNWFVESKSVFFRLASYINTNRVIRRLRFKIAARYLRVSLLPVLARRSYL